jgi:hypothetical protein
MMNKAMRVVELLWLAVAAVSLVEVFKEWGDDWNRTIKFSLFFGASVFMYFLRRKGRLKQMDK